MGKGKYDAGNAPWEVFERELEMAEEMPLPAEEPPPAGEVANEEVSAAHVRCAVDLLVKRISRPGSAEVFPWPGGPGGDVTRPGPTSGKYGRALLPGEPKGWPSIHRLLDPWFPGRLGVLVGSTGSGKTAWAVQVAEAVARYGAPVLYASAELDRVELAARFISLRSGGSTKAGARDERGVPWASILAMKTAEPELIEAGELLVSECPNLYLWAPPSAQRTIAALDAMTKAISKAHGGRAPFVVVDYIQRWTPDSVDDKRLAVSGLSARLRELSRPDDDGPWPGAAILALSSTARGNYSYLRDVGSLTLARDGGIMKTLKQNGEPTKRGRPVYPVDLVGLGKETGELEYDAPLVACLASNKGREDDPMGRRGALLVVPKNRHGHQGSIEWEFLAAVGRFVEGAPDNKPTPGAKLAFTNRRRS